MAKHQKDIDAFSKANSNQPELEKTVAYGVQNELIKAYGEAAQQIAERHKSGGNGKKPITTKERIKFIRNKLNISQSEFSELFQLSFSTVKNWEQESRGEPSGIASTYIKMIEADPEKVIEILIKIKENEEQSEHANRAREKSR